MNAQATLKKIILPALMLMALVAPALARVQLSDQIRVYIYENGGDGDQAFAERKIGLVQRGSNAPVELSLWRYDAVPAPTFTEPAFSMTEEQVAEYLSAIRQEAKPLNLKKVENALVLLARSLNIIDPDATTVPADIEEQVMMHLLTLSVSQDTADQAYYREMSLRFRNAKEAILFFGGTPADAVYHDLTP